MIVSFYCKKCGLDQDNFCHEETRAFNKQVYVSKCEKCRKEIIRGKNDPHDPYFKESKRVIIQARALKKDLIQYGEEGFQQLYRSAWLKFEQERERAEVAAIAKQQTRDKLYDKYKYDIEKKQILKKLYANE